MRKSKIVLCAIIASMILSACGTANEVQTSSVVPTVVSSSVSSESSVDKENDFEHSQLEEISADFEETLNKLTLEMEKTIDAVGDTYEDYKSNKNLISELIDTILSESDELFERTREKSISYFKSIAEHPKHKDYEFCDDALDEYYDTVCDDAMDAYYDCLCDDLMDKLYDTYCDGIIDDACDDLEYIEWSEAYSEAYEAWSNAYSVIYEKWSDEYSYLYGLRSDIQTAFCWDDNFDVDAIVEAYENGEQKAQDESVASSSTVPADTSSTASTIESDSSTVEESGGNNTQELDANGLRPEFKAAMDSYETFYDEYIEFMKTYASNPTDLQLIKEYGTMLVELNKMDKAFDEWDEDEMNDRELAYYLEVTSRVATKLLELQ